MYKRLWTDFHSNLHHEQIADLPKWYDHIAKIMDFWPIAYYPFYMRMTKWGLAVEDRYDDAVVAEDWAYLRSFVNRVNAEGYPMFMGYEWQGNGEDGDHNVFFLENHGAQAHPARYRELAARLKGTDAIAIPHHMAYQLGSRGKNWATHDERFSPVAEIYSSHGSSENDDGPLGMFRHVHMGPRTGQTCYEAGLAAGYKVGVIAAGDNHSVPGVFEHGAMCVLAADRTKEAIWEALLNRRTVAVSKSRIEVDFRIDDAVIGGETAAGETARLRFAVKGTNAVDRVEILKGSVLDEMVVHSGTWENTPIAGKIRFKFRVEFGWGPDARVYKDNLVKTWSGRLETNGRLRGVEKCWNNFGQKLTLEGDRSLAFDLTTYPAAPAGKWMGPGNTATEGFIFEVEDDADGAVCLTVDGTRYQLGIRDLLASSRIIPLKAEAEKRTREVWGDVTHYRDDPWWHNAYKIKIGRAAPELAYRVTYAKRIAVEEDACYRLRVWQVNGDAAWTSPIFVKRGRGK